ncbi:MAG: IclR family transcriptional regulator [Turicibacter sp.]|nr:IclR family transcriptional regulator [Turicibacter sp.]
MRINRTAKRTVEILELVASSINDLALKDIAQHLGMPKTSAYDILSTLVQCNMLYIKDPQLKTYAIGVKSYVIGNSYSKTSLLLQSSHIVIKDLAKSTGMPVLIVKENSGEAICTLKQEPPQKIIATPEVGDRGALHATAAGKAILAYAKNQGALLETITMEPLTAYTVTEPAALIAQLKKVKEQGFAVSDRENLSHCYGIAAPIFDHQGVVSAAVEAYALYREDYHPGKDIEAITEAAQKISGLLGWKGHV